MSRPICMHLRILLEMGVYGYTGPGARGPLITGDTLFECSSSMADSRLEHDEGRADKRWKKRHE